MGSCRGGSSAVAAGPLDAGGVADEEEEEEVTADSLRCGRRPLPLSALSAFSHVPPRRLDPKEHSCYDRRARWVGVTWGAIISGRGKTAGSTIIKSPPGDTFRQKDNADLSDSEHTSSRKQTQDQREELVDFNSQAGIISLYDCVFKKNPGYNQKLHRDDREHAKSLGLYVNAEEQERPVGVLTSSVYGRHIHQPVEPLNRDYSRTNNLETDFYRKAIPSFKAPGFGHISPA